MLVLWVPLLRTFLLEVGGEYCSRSVSITLLVFLITKVEKLWMRMIFTIQEIYLTGFEYTFVRNRWNISDDYENEPDYLCYCEDIHSYSYVYNRYLTYNEFSTVYETFVHAILWNSLCHLLRDNGIWVCIYYAQVIDVFQTLCFRKCYIYAYIYTCICRKKM